MMFQRPDYDAGDLVLCVWSSRPNSPNVGKVFRVARLIPVRANVWGVEIEGLPASGSAGWAPVCFRKIDPKPPTFFTGIVDEPVKVKA